MSRRQAMHDGLGEISSRSRPRITSTKFPRSTVLPDLVDPDLTPPTVFLQRLTALATLPLRQLRLYQACPSPPVGPPRGNDNDDASRPGDRLACRIAALREKLAAFTRIPSTTLPQCSTPLLSSLSALDLRSTALRRFR